VTLEIERAGRWQKAGTAEVNPEGWMALFRLQDWDDNQPASYRVTHPGGARYEGIIRRNPRDQDEIKVAVFTGNGNSDRGLRPDIVANIKAQDADLLFFSGDQSYDHAHHTAAWLQFGRQFGEIIKDRPTVTIPDDHDVGHGNLWGANGKKSASGAGDDGGYFMPVKYVNMVQRAQTSHLPDPYDPTPIQRDITVYYTALNVGVLISRSSRIANSRPGRRAWCRNKGLAPTTSMILVTTEIRWTCRRRSCSGRVNSSFCASGGRIGQVPK